MVVFFVLRLLEFYLSEVVIEGRAVSFAIATLKWLCLNRVFLLADVRYAHAYQQLGGGTAQIRPADAP